MDYLRWIYIALGALVAGFIVGLNISSNHEKRYRKRKGLYHWTHLNTLSLVLWLTCCLFIGAMVFNRVLVMGNIYPLVGYERQSAGILILLFTGISKYLRQHYWERQLSVDNLT